MTLRDLVDLPEIGWPMWCVFAAWTVFAVVWLMLMPRTRKDETFVRESNYNGSLFVTIPLSLALWWCGITRGTPVFELQSVAGLLLTLAGLGGALYARYVLGHYWDIHAAGRKDGTFLEVFPYSRVRHPIYSAQLLMCIGTALAAAGALEEPWR